MSSSVDVHFNGLTVAQAANLFAAIKHDYDGPAPTATPASLTASEIAQAAPETPAKRGRGRPRKDTTSPATAEPTPAPAVATAEPTPVPTDGAPTSELTLNDVRTALGEVMATKGEETCRALLDKFETPRISLIQPRQFPDFVAACKEAVA